MSFCFLYNVVSENHNVQNSPWGGGGGGKVGLLPTQGLKHLSPIDMNGCVKMLMSVCKFVPKSCQSILMPEPIPLPSFPFISPDSNYR